MPKGSSMSRYTSRNLNDIEWLKQTAMDCTPLTYELCQNVSTAKHSEITTNLCLHWYKPEVATNQHATTRSLGFLKINGLSRLYTLTGSSRPHAFN